MLPTILKILTGLDVVALAGVIYMLQLDAFDAIKKYLAIGAIALFVTGCGLVVYLEQIKPFIWDNTNPYKKQQQGGGDGGGAAKSGGKKKKGGGDGDGSGDDDSDDDESGPDGEGDGKGRRDDWSSKTRILDCDTCPEMVVITRGTFKMGAAADENDAQPNEQPQLPNVKVDSFAIGRYEVTRDQYKAFVTATKYQTQARCVDPKGNKVDADKPGFSVNGWHPRVCVSWDDAQAYTSWLGQTTGRRYRLPSAAEWEFAGRTGRDDPYQTGYSLSPRQAQIAGATKSSTVPVGAYTRNHHGLHDMHGNAAEWVEDCWTPTLKNLPATGSAFVQTIGCKRVVKGGSWAEPAASARFAARAGWPISEARSTIGFRVARELE